MSNELGHKAAKGTIWATVDKFSLMGCQFVVNLVMARLLMPEDFGVVGLISFFTAIATTLIDGGFGNALIQKKTPTQTDYSTVFYWNAALAVALYLILFICAPIIADFFNLPVLVGVTRVMSLTLIINSMLMIQTNRLRKKLAFKTLAIVDITSALIGGLSGIAFAYNGFGVYSIVLYSIIMGISQLIMLLVLERWMPSLCFSMETVKSLFGFGGYLLAANLLQTVCKNFQNIIIGRKYSEVQLGLYSQAHKLNDIAGYTIPQILVQVMYPVYSSIQDDEQRLREMLAMNVRVISFAIFPLIATLILIAEPLFNLLYGSKWDDAVPYFQILCCGGFFACLQNISFYAVAAKGYSKILFRWSIYKWSSLIIFMLIGMNFGMTGLLWSLVASEFNIYIINAILAHRYVGFTLKYQLTVLAPIALITSLSFIITFGMVAIAGISTWFMLPIFISIYAVLAYALRLQAIEELVAVLQKLRKK